MLIVKTNRSSLPEMFCEKGVLKICNKFTGEHPCQIAISIKLLCNFIEIALWHGCSPVNLPHIFRITFLKNTAGRLLLKEIKVESDLPNYATRLKNATGVDTSKFTKKTGSASLKSDVDELDMHKLKTLSVDLIKLNNVADNFV